MDIIASGNSVNLKWYFTDAVTGTDFTFDRTDIKVILYSCHYKAELSTSINGNCIEAVIPGNLPAGVYSLECRYWVGLGVKRANVLINQAFQITTNTKLATIDDELVITSVAVPIFTTKIATIEYMSAERYNELKELDSLGLRTLYVVQNEDSSLTMFIGNKPFSAGTYNGFPPDEEDLTSLGNVLKFKDRDTTKGKGYIILRTEKPIAEQIEQENTIYEVRYDFDLGGGTLEVPSGCILSFNGGCFKNGTIKGSLEFRNEPKFENVRVRLDNSHNSVNKIEGYGCYVETINNNWNDAKKISDLGISYVIYYNYKVGTEAHIIDSLYDMRLFAAFGIGVILYLDCTDDMIAEVAMRFANENNLIGWYVFDEPEARGISVERQDTRINVLKSIKNLPCCCATNGDYYTLSPISRNYDFIYLSQYYNLLNNVELNNTSDILNAYGRVTSFIDYGIDKIYPIYETYNATKDDDYLLHNLLVKKSLYKNKGCFFIYSPEWTSNEAAIGGIKYSEKLQNIVKAVINAEVPSCNMEIKGFCLGEVNHLSKAQSLIPLNSKAIVHTNDTEQLKGYPGIYFYSTGEYVEVVFNKSMKGARLILSWQNRGNNDTQKFDVIIPINSEKGYVVSSIDITPVNGKKTIYANIPNLNSDRFILKSSTINTGYQIIESLIVVGIPFGKNEVANGDIERYAIQRIGATSERPTLSSTWQFWTPDIGFMYYDLTLKKPIWWSYDGWLDVTGAQV